MEMSSLIIYIITFSLSSYFLYKAYDTNIYKRKCVFFLLSIALPFLLSGLRINIGTDYSSYVDIFYKISNSNNFLSFLNYDLFQIVIIKIFSFINLGPVCYFLLYSFLTILFIYKSIILYFEENKVYVFVAVFIYLFLFFGESFNTVNQSLAVAICVYSLVNLKLGNNLKCLLFLVFAISVHTSAFIFIPFIVIYHNVKKYNPNIISFLFYLLLVMFLFVVVCVIKYTNINISIPYFSAAQLDFGFGILALNLPLLILFFFFYKKQYIDYSSIIFLIAFCIYIVLMHLGYLNIFLNRFALYFSIYLVFLIPSILKNIDLKYTNIFILMVLLLSITYFIQCYYINGHGEIFPYMNCLF